MAGAVLRGLASHIATTDAGRAATTKCLNTEAGQRVTAT